MTFTVDRAATVRYSVARRLKGRRVGNRCVRPTSSNRTAKPCTRLVAVKGSFIRAAKPGANAFRFTGRLSKRRLVPGRYVLRARPRADGLAGKRVATRFTIVR